MPSIYIDFAADDDHWRGNADVSVVDSDALTGNHPALRVGDLEMVFTIPQLVTLSETLDAWLNGMPMKVVGRTERIVLQAIKDTITDSPESVRRAYMKKEPEHLAHELYLNMKLRGLKFRLGSDQEDQDEGPRQARIRRAMNKPEEQGA
jgi:hypothetical protein